VVLIGAGQDHGLDPGVGAEGLEAVEAGTGMDLAEALAGTDVGVVAAGEGQAGPTAGVGTDLGEVTQADEAEGKGMVHHGSRMPGNPGEAIWDIHWCTIKSCRLR